MIINKYREFVIYKKKLEETIQDIWTSLYKLRNNIITIKLVFASVFNTNKILYTLYNSLPIKFYITIATLKINKEKNKTKALRVL